MPPPDATDNGTVTVKNGGLLFGHVCAGNGGLTFEGVNGGGCDGVELRRYDYDETGGIVIAQYEMKINNNNAAGPNQNAVALLTFSQPVSTTSVVITSPSVRKVDAK